MAYKKIIPFINGENELASNIVRMAQQYCFQGAELMMIYNLQNFRFINIINGLIFLIMIYQNYFFLTYIQETTSGNKSFEFSMFINDWEITVFFLCHHFLDVFYIITHMERTEAHLYSTSKA